MTADGPWDRYHPDSLGWLHRRMREGRVVLAEDVARIVDANPETVTDPVLRSCIIAGLRRELKKKRGPQESPVRELKMLYAATLVEDLTRRLAERSRRQRAKGIRKIRGGYGPSELAHLLVACRLRFNSWEALRNALSSRRKDKNLR